MTKRLDQLIAPAFYDLHDDIRTNAATYFWFKGGRGSTKSSFSAVETILEIMRDPEANALVLRKYSNTLRDSVMSSLKWAIHMLGVEDFFDSTVSPMEIVYKPTGQKIILKGLDDPLKLKSLSLVRGYFKIVWFEELAEFHGAEEVRSVLQSALRGGKQHIIFMTYNPPDDPGNWVNKEAEAEMPRRIVHHSTYLDVPSEWLGEQFIQDANTLKERDYDKYRHEYLGEVVGRSDIAVFGGKWVVQDFEPQDDWDGPYYGGDWGFAEDPTALVKMWIHDETLYIEYEAYASRVDIEDTPELFDKVPGAKQHTIRADCSRPETISHMNNKGYNVLACKKWTGCVEDGVTVIRGFKKIVIHSRCKNMQEEARLYSYKIDRLTKEVLPVIVDKYNHLWDAVRYGLENYIMQRMAGFTEQQMIDSDRIEKSTLAPSMESTEW